MRQFRRLRQYLVYALQDIERATGNLAADKLGQLATEIGREAVEYVLAAMGDPTDELYREELERNVIRALKARLGW